jgi:hypothetical protein
MAKRELGIAYEYHNGKYYIHWYCKKYGDVLDTVQLGKQDPPSGDVPEVREVLPGE